MAKRRKIAAPSAEHLSQIEDEFRRETRDKPNPAMAPISQVSAESAKAQQLADPQARVQLAHDTADAKRYRAAAQEGRVILSLPLDAIQPDVLVRDRTILDPDEMQELKTSIAANGVRLPIEVFTRREGRRAYALLSGFRRLRAVTELLAETGEERFKTIPCLLRDPESLGGGFAAMVEENEVRASLSHYERGRIAVVAAQRKAFASTEAAVADLFKSASKAKRSKIRSFAVVFEELGDLLEHAEALKERDGLRLAAALRAGAGADLRTALEVAQAGSADAEWAALAPVVAQSEKGGAGVTKGRPKKSATPKVLQEVALSNGVRLRGEASGADFVIRLKGKTVDEAMLTKAIAQLQKTLET